MTQITYTVNAYINPSYNSIDRVRSGQSTPLLLNAEPGCSSLSDYTFVGHGSVTLDVVSDDEYVSAQISALNSQLQTVRAEAQQKENQILLQISKLQALTMG
jgi:hypothetical protein